MKFNSIESAVNYKIQKRKRLTNLVFELEKKMVDAERECNMQIYGDLQKRLNDVADEIYYLSINN